MTATIKITLDDDVWSEYTEINKELFLEDLFSNWKAKDGVKSIDLINLSKANESEEEEKAKIYALIRETDEVDSPFGYDKQVMMLSLDYNTIKAKFDSHKEEIENWVPKDRIEIEEVTDTSLKYFIGNWSYAYSIEEYTLD